MHLRKKEADALLRMFKQFLAAVDDPIERSTLSRLKMTIEMEQAKAENARLRALTDNVN